MEFPTPNPPRESENSVKQATRTATKKSLSRTVGISLGFFSSITALLFSFVIIRFPLFVGYKIARLTVKLSAECFKR